MPQWEIRNFESQAVMARQSFASVAIERPIVKMTGDGRRPIATTVEIGVIQEAGVRPLIEAASTAVAAFRQGVGGETAFLHQRPAAQRAKSQRQLMSK